MSDRSVLTERLAVLQQAGSASGLAQISRGLEKESLRVTPAGKLAQTPHPRALGSTLTHPSITTDYSEALLEFITAPSHSVSALLGQLDDIHRFVYTAIGDERLWVNSMPCQLNGDSHIPLAEYGSSNSGQMKTLYREGLGHRYGRLMQTIAGVHFNISLDDTTWQLLQHHSGSPLSLQAFKTEQYLAGIRNFRRNFWLLLYLFGAAPAVCRSFVAGRDHPLVAFGDDPHTLHTPYATSLRMGNLGYQSDAQSSLVVCYNNLAQYRKTLLSALVKPYPAYEQIGLTDASGRRLQLNTHLLQIENEFYSPIRPKRTSESGEAPVNALSARGIEYIEVRSLDLDPFATGGIAAETIRFLDLFVLHCLLAESPEVDESEYRENLENQSRMVYRGRDPALTLQRGGVEVGFQSWAGELLTALEPIATLMDAQGNASGPSDYVDALAAMQARVADSSLTPSAQILAQLRERGETFYQWAAARAVEQRDDYCARPLPAEALQAMADDAARSLADQAELERDSAAGPSFEQFLADYYRQYQLD